MLISAVCAAWVPVCTAQYVEMEPNNTVATAQTIGPLSSGSTITGTSIGAAAADYLLLRVVRTQPGIYRQRVVLTSASAGHLVQLRALSQENGVPNPASDASLQLGTTGTTPPRMNQWYGFGLGEEVVYRVTGGAGTALPYVVTFASVRIEPRRLPVFSPGEITITTVGQNHDTDTDLWVYDASFHPIAEYGNDDAPPASPPHQSTLTRTFPPGVYYLAMSNYDLANELPSTQSDEGFRGGRVLAHPGAAVSSSFAVGVNCSFSVIDQVGVTAVPAFRTEPFEILWFRLDVGVAESPGACCLDMCRCVITSAEDCESRNGVFNGSGTSCPADPALCRTTMESRCDWNAVNGLDSQDYFDFLDAFFVGEADYNCDAIHDSQDLFDFMDCYGRAVTGGVFGLR